MITAANGLPSEGEDHSILRPIDSHVPGLRIHTNVALELDSWCVQVTNKGKSSQYSTLDDASVWER